MRSIEIQRREKNKWSHHAFYDDADLALTEAKRLAGLGRYQGVRVIEDEFRGPSDTSRSKYLFRSMADNRPGPTTSQTNVAKIPCVDAPLRRTGGAANRHTNPYLLLLLFLFIVTGGLVALAGLQIMFSAL
jgi:hypothetical protein